MPRISDLPAAAALAGTEELAAVQSTTKAPTVDQINDYVHANPPSGIANTVTILDEHQFTEDDELDYSASFSDGMADATITFTELPLNTIAISVFLDLADTGTEVHFNWKRSSGGTQTFAVRASFADVGTNGIRGLYWMPTSGNTLRVTDVAADTTSTFIIVGYKTGA